MSYKRSICSIHDEIVYLAEKIVAEASAAKDAGERMEGGLIERKSEAEDMEKEIDRLNDELRFAEKDLETMTDERDAALSRVAELEAIIGG